MNVILRCESCGGNFEVPFKQRNKKYCNRECYKSHGIKGRSKNNDFYEDRTCVNCNNVFNIRKKLPNKLCSDKCRVEWSKKPEVIENKINKTKESIYKKYGVESLFFNKEFRDKLLEIRRNRSEEEKEMTSEKIKKRFVTKFSPLISERLLNNNLKLKEKYEKNKNGTTSKPYEFECLKCNSKFTSTLLGSGKIPICRVCYPINKNSTIEGIIRQFLIENNIKFINTDRKILKGKEIDFLIESHKIALEVDGLFYHSENYGGKDKFYHINKTKESLKNGYKLIHIFEDEILNKPEIVFSRLRNIFKLNTNNKISGRKCVVKEIPKNESKVFFNENHLQGDGNDSIRLGLFYMGNIVSLMSFGKQRVSLGKKNKGNNYELIRFSNKINTIVNGGFSKLLNHFVTNYTFDELITYSDVRWSGLDPFETVYYKNNFTFSHLSPPNYWYLKNGSSKKRYHRFGYRKNILLSEGWDVSMTEWEIMQMKKYDRVWDCGNLKFIYNQTN